MVCQDTSICAFPLTEIKLFEMFIDTPYALVSGHTAHFELDNTTHFMFCDLVPNSAITDSIFCSELLAKLSQSHKTVKSRTKIFLAISQPVQGLSLEPSSEPSLVPQVASGFNFSDFRTRGNRESCTESTKILVQMEDRQTERTGSLFQVARGSS